MATLTLAAAKDYVAGYYASQDDVGGTPTIEGCGIIREGSFSFVRLNVAIMAAPGDTSAIHVWDVFLEDDGCGGSVLRGEF